ncbi:D-2-hydroxyacid dehydrogenase [Photobacterium lucens]|uniref:D-2-hydroxyacid dehydrogenase n=1 Tax=Photobacterium lucens TaxID=2562949 RepID=UPI0013694869|nr:D-2-hydroxyacid dehydrogenase [Photobacterium lucens]MBP2700136.1 D-2-hydroxyacid dehydrogenase [Vibrio parahaemolyticus]MZG57050.1 D-2-hydroxyacid dehydrogenase [Photobacterium lucens]MZG82445.1 D-2-hydroxyacid dehydrogenase [Photobacterium lucens]
MIKVSVISKQQQRYTELLAQAQLPDLCLTEDPSQASVILADPPLIANQLHQFTQLKWLQSTFAGIDALIQPDLRQDYLLTNIKGCFGHLIGEYVISQCLNYYRHFPQYQQQQQQALWQPIPYQSLSAKTMVIIGTGSIGCTLATIASAFNCRIIGVNRSGESSANAFDAIYPITQLSDALNNTDIIVSTLPATAQTCDLFSSTIWSGCHQALFFNVGRGNTVIESDLIKALDTNHLAHAYLDVFKQEPLPEDHLFWHHPKISITPHIAAESFPEQVVEIFKTNYLRFHQQQKLDYLIDFKDGY